MHHAHFVRPQPGFFFIHVVPEQHGLLVPGGFDCPLILACRDDKRRTFLARSRRHEFPQHRTHNRRGNNEHVETGFHQLFFANVVSRNGQIERQSNKAKSERYRTSTIASFAAGHLMTGAFRTVGWIIDVPH